MSTFLTPPASAIWRCTVCKADKSWDAFYMRTHPNGRRRPKNPCKECLSAQRKQLRKEQPERFRREREKLLEHDPDYFVRWRQNNRERSNAYTRKWRLANIDRVRSDALEYQRAHLALYAKHTATRRARKLEAFVEEIDRNVVFDRDQGICGICRKVVTGKFHIDHIVPLSKGGQHSYTNVQIAHPTCNQRKHAKLASPVDE